MRPMRPEDEPAVIALLHKVSPEDLRQRFLHPIKEFQHSFVARLTQLDYARAMAFVAIDPEAGEVIGVVRLHADSRYEKAEYAILLRSDLKGRGLGWQLMQLLIDYARAEGLTALFGEVSNENITMLAMCRELGVRREEQCPRARHFRRVAQPCAGGRRAVPRQSLNQMSARTEVTKAFALRQGQAACSR